MDASDVVAIAAGGASVLLSIAALIVSILARRDSRTSARAAERSAAAAESSAATGKQQLTHQLTPRLRLEYVGVHQHDHDDDEVEVFELHLDGPTSLDTLEVRLSGPDVNLIGVQGLAPIWQAGEDEPPEHGPLMLTGSMVSEDGRLPVGGVVTFGAVLDPGHGDVRFLVVARRGEDGWQVPVTTHVSRPGPPTRPYRPRLH